MARYINNSNNNNNTTGGIGFGGLLTLTFIVLKLCNVIQWSWWWVLSPIWIGLIILILFIAFLLLVKQD